MKITQGLDLNRMILGVMSGTSCDGLDLALCRFHGNAQQPRYSFEKTVCIPYSDTWKARLRGAIRLSALELAVLENDWTRWVAQQINLFLKDVSESPVAIGFHGHTVFHQPEKGFTWQMGSGATLSVLTGIDTIGNFRQQDVALGGQGAPLVPIGEYWLFNEYTAFMNLGGFANVSVRNNDGGMYAWDVCALNVVLNRYSALLGKDFDAEGSFARSGKVSTTLLEELHALPYFTERKRGSLGIEWVEQEIIPILEAYRCGVKQDANGLDMTDVHHLLATFTAHAGAICGAALPDGKVLLSGGGTHNHTLVDYIRLNTQALVEIPEPELNDFKEALIFAFLAHLRIEQQAGSISMVTGASRPTVLGGWYSSGK